MNSLMRTVNSTSYRRNMLVRESLQQQLMTVVLEMQSAPGVLDGKPVEICDEVLALCSALEALFLHGLKDSLLNRVTEAINGPDYDAMPQPSFWGPLLVFSHRQIIDQIQSLTQVTTEVGYCRAWIRIVLNDGLLTSYLAAIRRDNSALKPYYDRAAFIRDADLLEIAQRLLESIDYIRFQLAVNSSLLNFWSTTPLLMAAIWSPPMKSCPVFSAIDIAKTISSEQSIEQSNDEIETASSIGSLSSFNSSQSTFNNFLSEDDALKIILSKKSNNLDPGHSNRPTTLNLSPLVEKEFRENRRPHSQKETKEEPVDIIQQEPPVLEDSKHIQVEEKQDISVEILENKAPSLEIAADESKTDFQTAGNSLIGKVGWSTSHEDCESSLNASMVSKSESLQTPAEAPSYDALLKSYHTGNYQSPNLKELLEKYPVYEPPTAPVPEVQPGVKNFDEVLIKLPREKGLDAQNYNCLECGQLIGLTFSKQNVCNFAGDYFCTSCMSLEEFLIPSRIIHNWDFKKYPVSLKAANYLTSCATLIDLKVINPKIYNAVSAMAQLQTLRVQLNYLRAYLFTCREPVIESLQSQVNPRDYLYEHIHQYSISDLTDIPSGTMAQQLQRVVEFARNHVLNCWLCSQKGFICEMCTDSKAIYPFDTQLTYRCGSCHAVFHSQCLNSTKPCPKCERRCKRMDLPLLDLENTDSIKESLGNVSG